MKLKRIFICLLFAGYIHAWNAQQSINAAGTTVSGVDGQISFSVGQVFVAYQQGADANIQEGVQQAYTIITNSTSNIPGNTDIILYPNPTSGAAYLAVNSTTEDQLKIEIFDMQGKMEFGSTLQNGINSLQLKDLPSGIYMVYVKRNNNKLFTQKLIKI